MAGEQNIPRRFFFHMYVFQAVQFLKFTLK